MPMEEEPVVGAMYEDEDGLAFEVLSFDEDEGIIEVQYEDGEVSEIDIDSWYELDLEQLSASEDVDEDDSAGADTEKRTKRAPAPEEDEDDDIDDFDDGDDGDDDNY
jgi:hypothetical protein